MMPGIFFISEIRVAVRCSSPNLPPDLAKHTLNMKLKQALAALTALGTYRTWHLVLFELL